MLLKTNQKLANTPEKAAQVFQKMLQAEDKISRDQEHVWVLSIGGSNTIKNIELVALGSSDTVIVSPTQIFRRAITNGASYIMICHNHPSGSMKPSGEDKTFTQKIVESGELLQISVIDHLIIDENNFYSFRQNGLI